MLFNSYTFLFAFLPLTLIVFCMLELRGWQKISRCWLVGASLYFYGRGEPQFVWLLVGSIVINFAIGQWLQFRPDEPELRRRLVLTVGVVANLSALAWFKYRGFLGEFVGSFYDHGADLGEIVLPLAISFFTFQQVAFLVDSFRGCVKSSSFLSYCLFVTFFPQLIAGPIVHHSEMLPQFDRERTKSSRWELMSVGVTVFFIGLFKKVVIADSVARYAIPVFDAADSGITPTFYAAWAGTAAYAFQIYFDFSGYSDMAIGLGYLFGVRLPDNFLSPYKATNMIEFWRRWHITLSRFLRDYLYIPLGGNRFGPLRRYRNLMVTMLLGGLWHGAAWTFVIWGGLHGVYLAINHLWHSVRGERAGSKVTVWFSRAVTLYFVAIAWVFFRAHTLGGASEILISMHGWYGIDLSAPFSRVESFAWLAILLVAIWILPNTAELLQHAACSTTTVVAQDLRPCIRWRPNAVWSAAIASMGVSAIVMISRGGEFLYYHF